MILQTLKKKIIDIESCKNTRAELLPSSVKRLAVCKLWYNILCVCLFILSFGKIKEVRY
jgi:hypothetical protein